MLRSALFATLLFVALPDLAVAQRAQPVGAGDGYLSKLESFVDVRGQSSRLGNYASEKVSSLEAWLDHAALLSSTRSWIASQVHEMSIALPAWMPSSNGWSSLYSYHLPEGAMIDLRQAVASGLEVIPSDPHWWGDFALSAVTDGVVVGFASYSCAIVATPAGPAAIALVQGACGLAGSRCGRQWIKHYYDWWGRDAQDSALDAGAYLGAFVAYSAPSTLFARLMNAKSLAESGITEKLYNAIRSSLATTTGPSEQGGKSMLQIYFSDPVNKLYKFAYCQ